MSVTLPIVEEVTEADRGFGRALARFDPAGGESLAWLGALVARGVRMGHACFTVAQLPEEARAAARRAIEELRSKALGSDTEVGPLVRDGERLYLRRAFEWERDLAIALVERAQSTTPVDPDWLEGVLDRLLGRADPEDPRRIAIATAIESRLLVLTGGPGTGKTSTVVRLLAALVEAARRRDHPPPRVELLAPTGKAAARLAESIRTAVATLDVDPWTREAIPLAAKTIHRALGMGATGRPRFDADNPWSADVVLVDEASMVDLELMHRVVSATRSEARLILLGDPNQLSSVEAGAVLADLAADGTRISDSVVRLVRSHRYSASSGVGRLAAAVLAGETEEALAILEQSTELRWREHPRERLLDEMIAVQRAIGGVDDPVERHRLWRGERVVCARRRGPFGVADLNRRMRRELDQPDERFFDGLPIFVRRNDATVGLFNGDVGIVSGEAAVCFESSTNEVRPVATALVPPHDDAFAMTVHQAQGSEFDAVSIVLAGADSSLASRELLYTALTRAKTSVTVYGTREAIAAAIKTREFRDSGLVDRLR